MLRVGFEIKRPLYECFGVKMGKNENFVLGVLTPSNLHYSIGLAGRSYNSVSTPVLYCDVQFLA